MGKNVHLKKSQWKYSINNKLHEYSVDCQTSHSKQWSESYTCNVSRDFKEFKINIKYIFLEYRRKGINNRTYILKGRYKNNLLPLRAGRWDIPLHNIPKFDFLPESIPNQCILKTRIISTFPCIITLQFTNHMEIITEKLLLTI